MKEFKVGDTVRRMEDFSGDLPIGQVVEVSRVDKNLLMVKGHNSWFCVDNFDLCGPKYPNPPHKHADVIIEWAKGADVEKWGELSMKWLRSSSPIWNTCVDYRVKPTQSQKEIKIAKLEAKLVKLRSEL